MTINCIFSRSALYRVSARANSALLGAVSLLVLSLANAPAAAAQELRGIVYTAPDMMPLAGVEIAVEDERGTLLSHPVETDSSGRFVISGISGEFRLRVRSFAFTQQGNPLYTLMPGESLDVEIIMTAFVKRLMSDGFERRRTQGHGTFYTRADLVNRQTLLLSDLLNEVVGTRVHPGRPGGEVAFRRTPSRIDGDSFICSPRMFLDGTYLSPFADPEPLMSIGVRDLYAVEIYRGRMSTPIEFQGRGRACGAVVVWTLRSAAQY
jgi:hypothetical protein